MENPMACTKCGSTELKLVPAGVSKKTGKTYDAFYACKSWECGGTIRIPKEGENPTTSPTTPYRASYAPQPKKDMKTTMDYKADQIHKAQDAKEESMRLFSSGRDATLIVTAIMDKGWDDKLIEDTLLKWRKFFYTKVYKMDEDEYRLNNSPF